MPSKIVTAAAVALGLVHPASAETRISVGSGAASSESAPSASIALARLGTVSGGRVRAFALTTAADGNATLTFKVTTASARPVEVRALVDVARGARVIAMNVTIGGRALHTYLDDVRGAQRSYFGTVDRKQDPALLEWIGSTETGSELQLRVFPLSKMASAHVELTIEPPRDRPGFDLGMSRYVSTDASLVALEQPRATIPLVYIGCGFKQQGDLDKAIIRRYVTRNLPRVKACYERELLRTPKLVGKAELHFSIGNDGKTHGVSVDGDLPSDVVKSCIADDLAQWEFPAVVSPRESTIRVNYPITFVPSGY